MRISGGIGKESSTSGKAHQGTGRHRRTSLPAKLIPPTLTNVITRKHLFKLLDAARRKPVIWINAQAGAGKTTLIANYLAARKIKPLWYQMDVRDADPATFFAYLRMAIGKFSPRKRETIPLLTPEYALGLPVYAHNFFEQLFARMRIPAVLVLDNYQDVPESAPIHDFLAQAISALPPGINIICISRSDAPPAFARVRATQQLSCLDPDALTLSLEEARQLGAICSPATPGHEIIALNKRAGGWAAGLVLLLERASDAAPQLPEITEGHVYDFFAAEVMQFFEPEVQDFLAQSALFPVMNVALTSGLTGNPDAADILRGLVRRNYFIVRRPGVTTSYEFHPLFREYLLSELGRRTPHETLRTLQRKAGNMLALHGDYEAAADLLRDAEDFAGLTLLILAHAEKLVNEGRFQILGQWLQAIPEQVRQTQPWLEYWLGVSLMPTDPKSARKYFMRAYDAFSGTADAAGLYLSWSGIADSFVLIWDDFSDMDNWMEKYRKLRNDFPVFPSQQIASLVHAAVFGTLIYIRPQSPELHESRTYVEGLLRSAPDPNLRIKIAINLSLYYAWSGAFQDLRRVVNLEQQIIDTESVTPLSRIIGGLTSSILLWITGETIAAEGAVNNVLKISAASGVHFMDAISQAQLIYARGLQGNITGMGAALEITRGYLSPHRRLDIAHYHYQMGWYESLKEDYAEALIHARMAANLSHQMSSQTSTALCEIGLAKVLIQTGEYEEAHSLLDTVQEFALSMPSPHIELAARAIRAYSWLCQGKESACKAELRTAFRLAAENSYWTFLPSDHKILSRLCTFALQHCIETEYTKALILKWRLLPYETSAAALESWPWPIRLYTLGHFMLVIDGKPFTPEKKTPRKPLELLKLLACNDGEIGTQQASNILWPEYDAIQAQNSLKATINRLRKIIGKETLLQHSGKLQLNKGLMWADIWAFDMLAKEIKENSQPNQTETYRQLQALYLGALLPDDDSLWYVIHARSRLHDIYISEMIEHIKVLDSELDFHIRREISDINISNKGILN